MIYDLTTVVPSAETRDDCDSGFYLWDGQNCFTIDEKLMPKEAAAMGARGRFEITVRFTPESP